MIQPCTVCGQKVRAHNSKEGTGYFEGLEAKENDRLKREIDTLKKVLKTTNESWRKLVEEGERRWERL